MSRSPQPITPENKPRPLAQSNRSFTVPAKFATPPQQTQSKAQPAEAGSAEDIETLYGHFNAHVVKFTTPPRTSSPGRPKSAAGALPWTTATERTVTEGGFIQVYRHKKQGMSFLSAGAILQPILPRGQSWCVDGVSKFVFSAGPDTYIRVELPVETDEDRREVEEFKDVLRKVMFFERTLCPFARGFNVELPEEQPEVEVKRRRKRSSGVAKKWKIDSVYGWRPEGWTGPEARAERDEASESASGSQAESGDESESASGQEEAEEVAEAVSPLNTRPSVKSRASALRSATMPQPAVQQSMPTSKLWMDKQADGTIDSGEPIERDADDSEVTPLRTFQAIPTDMPPSPPDSSAGVESYPENRVQPQQGLEAARVVEDLHQAATVAEVERRKETFVNFEDLEDSQSEADEVEQVTASKTPEDVHSEEVSPPVPTSAEGDEDTEKTVILAEPFIEEHGLEPAVTRDPFAMTEDETVEHVTLEAKYEPGTLLNEIDAQTQQLRLDESIEVESAPHSFEHQQEPQEQQRNDRPITPPNPIPSHSEDPYAAIQARILARRSLSGTTSFHPLHKSPTRSSTSSTSSTGTIISNRSRTSTQRAQQDAFATAMVRRLLGPPAHLVTIMLQIAARFANGAFGVNSMFYVESPADSPRKVPGSYAQLIEAEYAEGVVVEGEESDEERKGWEDEEDDFGVPIDRQPSNLAGMRERSARSWDVD